MKRVDSSASEISTMSGENGDDTIYHVRKSKLLSLINWTHVVTVYSPQIFLVLIVSLLAQLLLNFEKTLELHFNSNYFHMDMTLRDALDYIQNPVIAKGFQTTVVVLIITAYLAKIPNPTYLLSFATFKAPESWKVSHADIMKLMELQGSFTEESSKFLSRMLERSGTGQSTAWPPSITRGLTTGEKSDSSIEASRKESETVIFEVVQDALDKARVKPKDVDFLVINCSLFSPTPSLCAMVCNKFGFRSDCETFNLGGMGCSASPISIKLAQSLLKTKSSGILPFGGGGVALVVSTEIIGPNLYTGNKRSFLLQNTLFRCGGAAVVLSNKWGHGSRAWYKLLHVVRVQNSDEKSYNCVYEAQDETMRRGIALSKEIVKVAGKTMEKNFVKLGPLILPISEQVKVLFSIIKKHMYKAMGSKERVQMYVPDFKKAVDHFCIHAGGRAVIDGIEKNLSLAPYHTEPSRMTLLNYGNTSSSSIWYELEYIHYYQKTNKIKKGDRVLQIAFGSGFKCNSAIWLKL